MKKKIFKILITVIVILANIGCDQSTKFLAKTTLQKKETRHIIDNYIILRYEENNSGFLSVFSSFPDSFKTIVLTIIPIIALFAIFVFLIFNAKVSIFDSLSWSFIIGGGFSNLYDRLFNNQYVIDFMNIGIGPIRSGIFNCADLSIMIGSFLLLVSYYHKTKLKVPNL